MDCVNSISNFRTLDMGDEETGRDILIKFENNHGKNGDDTKLCPSDYG